MIVWPFQRKSILESEAKNYSQILVFPFGVLNIVDCPIDHQKRVGADLSRCRLRLFKFSRLVLYPKSL